MHVDLEPAIRIVDLQNGDWGSLLSSICALKLVLSMPVLIDVDIFRTLLIVVEWLGCSGLYFCDRPV